MTNEIHPAVESNNVRARRIAEEAKHRADIADKRKRAINALLVRLAVVAALGTVICMLRSVGFMSVDFALLGIMVLGAWMWMWVGSWMHYMSMTKEEHTR